jgi:predicted dehydrogenase/nucleoside-diphosphate-sugar epimerase
MNDKSVEPTVPKRRIALLGAGYIADWHAQCLQSVADVELVAVCDGVRARAQALAAKFGIPNVYASLDLMLASEKLDAVHILIPPDRHFDATRTVLEAGIHAFLEKPMCDRAADCDALVQLAAERGLRLGVGHNFLFSEPYELLRDAIHSGILGRIDHVTIAWNRFLPQSVHGPFDIWMLRDPRNIMLEIGSHSVASMLDLVGIPDAMEVRASNPIDLPTGRRFYRRWQVDAFSSNTAVELRFSFVPAFSEYTIHVRGSLAAASVDFERNTFTLLEHRPSDPDFETYAMVTGRAKSLKQQARRTLLNYVKSKLHLTKRGTPYGTSIARAMDAFYAPQDLPPRIDGRTGATVIRLCEQIGAQANLPSVEIAPRPIPAPAATNAVPHILVLGGTGFIGKELVRQLLAFGHNVRLLVRSSASLPESLRVPAVDCQIGNLASRDDLMRAMDGVDYVFHLARASVKTWADYQEFEIGATQQVAECALAAGVKRLIYTGTIDSYYAGCKAGVITESTPLDPNIERRNLYARAKAASEVLLMRMHREQGLPVVILRPGVVIGRGGSPFHWGVGMWWSDAVCQIWGEGNNKLALVLVEDVAKGLIAAMDKPAIDGLSFNLVADPCLTAQEYLDELDRAGHMRIQRYATPIWRFYLIDMIKWVVKVAVRHKDRRLPSYRDWEGRTQHARFDCSAAKNVLGWKPVSTREEMVRKGIEVPLKEFLR